MKFAAPLILLLVYKLDHRRIPGMRFLQKHIETIFHQSWTEVQSIGQRTFEMFFEACELTSHCYLIYFFLFP